MFCSRVLERHYKKNRIKGRFKTSDKLKKHFQSWDSAVHTSEKQTEGKVYMASGRCINFNRKLTTGHSNNKVDPRDYKMKIFVADKKTKKMYEEYYKTHSYT